ncbi:C39 family peptidase [Tichowtungia aerotolerans]|uniref:Peptidase C39-like domain-containing protein n=1 Tax=Tichowtungia aerotolerans TaxID=2697043 RepID=A0A6P1M694_9BACT|nr:C39 family peptidase [Tichowtungia aerotolerans]QHI68523.1 hypothetical protein GT409_03320 [Tichowtungia aerotolerans]
MKQLIVFICVTVLSILPAKARTWTNTKGKTFEAEVVWINEDKEVKLASANGETIVVPFAGLSAENEEYLEDLLFRQIHGEPHPVSWKKMNELFGLNIWKDVYVFDDHTKPAGERMQLEKESETDFMENYRAYPLGKEQILSEPVYTSVLYGGKQYVESLCFVFLNQGDIPLPEQMSDGFVETMTEDIEASGMRVHDAIVPILGEPKRDTIGKGSMREKVWRWDWNDQSMLLSVQEGKYAMMRILPAELADRSGKVEEVESRELRKQMKSCVERRDNGDVIIRNIPMIDQGPKGYCSPATWERYLRYLGIPANMYQLANAGNTGIGGGTHTKEMIDATESLLFTNGRNLKEIEDPLEIQTISEYIDDGMPIMWSFATSSDLQREINRHNARRNERKIEEKENTGANVHGGHICLIMGYNRKIQEFAISDSWGPKFNERWVPIDLIDYIPYSVMNVIRW